jgi:hypothetical protein
MEDAKLLSAFLSVLCSHWDKFTEELDDAQMVELSKNISELEKKIGDSESSDEIEAAASEFLSVMKTSGSVNDLIAGEGKPLRSGSLPLPETEIKIKIINYCAIINDKILVKEEDER